MASNKLNAKQVANLSEVGKYSDGDGLYLLITKHNSKSWLFRYQMNGKRREMGLGGFPTTTLAAARTKARDAREKIGAGVDPLTAKQASKAAQRAAQAKQKTFKQCANDYIALNEASWRNPKHRQQWHNTLKTYAFPAIGDLNVADIETIHITDILEPIWHSKTETATRVRGRIQRVLDYAKVKGLRDGENPARWDGHLKMMLPAPTKLKNVQHHKAMPYQEVPGLMLELEANKSVSSLALQFIILTACRSGEALGATWGEIDLNAKTWSIPASRMKAGQDHAVPLSYWALETIKKLPRIDNNPHLFAGQRHQRPISAAAIAKLLNKTTRKNATIHGFRSSFRDWAGEQTNFPRNDVERCLAHTLQDKTEAAYYRSNILEKRRKIMDAWAKQCARATAQTSSVIPIARKSS